MNIYDTKTKVTTSELTWNYDAVTNWSMTERSQCYIVKARDVSEIRQALATARAQRLSVIARGAGHSYTDAALNTNGVIIDTTGMDRILSWDPERGIMHVEPGVTVYEMVRVALADRWWPAVTPSTSDATIAGCVSMNVNGKNAWKQGSFGEHLLSLTVLLADGQMRTLSPMSDPELFLAFVGSAGLLGIVTSVTLQLQRIPSGRVNVCVQPAASFGEILRIFQEEQSADYLEAWVDGFAGGRNLGRGVVTSTTYSTVDDDASLRLPKPGILEQLTERFAHYASMIARPAMKSGVRVANSVLYWWNRYRGRKLVRQKSLFRSTYYSPAVYTWYRALLPQGSATFQAFVPYEHAEYLFKEIMRRSQENNFIPLWCVVKQHRQSPFLLCYQVDGFSLELNYKIVPHTAHKLRKMQQEWMELVIAVGGKFYLAKDSLLTSDLYRQSIGDDAVDTFIRLKQIYDPDMLFQSNLFRRVL